MVSIGAIDVLLNEMGEDDYSTAEYDFFYRNCNHFCDDLSQRLVGEGAAVSTHRYRYRYIWIYRFVYRHIYIYICIYICRVVVLAHFVQQNVNRAY